MYTFKYNFCLQVFAAIFLQLFLSELVNSSCSENVCENIHDIYDGKMDKNWNFVHLKHWYPVRKVFLKANTFINYKKLEYITITKLINGIDEKAFTGLTNLHTVVFVDNIINGIPKDLFNSSPIEKIVIKNCKLQLIQQNIFKNLDTLTHLKIEDNDFRDLKNGMFPDNLIELSVKGNGITYVETNTFNRLKKLQILDLSNNYITSFEFKNYLSHNKKLKNLRLSFNLIPKITILPTLEKLKYLYLDNNSIAEIQDNSFGGLANLEILNLAGNNIREISNNHFANLKYFSMNKIYLSNNNLTCTNENFLGVFPNLRSFWVGGNPLKCNCFRNIKRYSENNNINLPYNFDYEWNVYSNCSKYLLQ